MDSYQLKLKAWHFEKKEHCSVGQKERRCNTKPVENKDDRREIITQDLNSRLDFRSAIMIS